MAAIVAFAVAVVIGRRRVAEHWDRQLERRLQSKKAEEGGAAAQRLRLMPLKAPLIVLVGLALTTTNISQDLVAPLIFSGYLVIALAVSMAIFYHVRNAIERQAKYDFLFFAAVVFWYTENLDLWGTLKSDVLVALGALMSTGGVIVLQLIGSAWAHRWERMHAALPPRSLRITYYRLALAAPYILVSAAFLEIVYLATSPRFILQYILGPLHLNYGWVYTIYKFLPFYIVTMFLVLRYVAGGQIKRWPIVYVRSFNYAEVPVVFRQIISASFSRAGKIFLLAHALQPPNKLRDGVAAEKQAQIAILSDSAWRTWMSDMLGTAYFVICDLTVESQSVLWELEEAMKKIAHDRIIVVYGGEAEPSINTQLFCVRYLATPAGLRSAKEKIDEWIRGHIYSGA